MAKIGELLGFGGNPFYQAFASNRNAFSGAFGGMAANPMNPWGGFAQGAAYGGQQDQLLADQKAAEAKEQEAQNATMEWLQSQGYDDLVSGVESGGLDIGSAWSEGLKRGQPATATADWAKLNDGTLFNQRTGETMALEGMEGGYVDPKDMFAREKDLAAQYGGQDPVKTYQAVRNGYERVRASATENTGAGDISMIFAYMKMLDPTSVVREGEFATAETAGGAGEQIANLYNRVLSGERLTPELRKEFLAAADKLYQESSQNLSSLNEQYTTRAGAWGVDPARFVVSPETYQPVGGAGPRTTSTGVNWSF